MTIRRTIAYTVLVAVFASAVSALAYRTGRIDRHYFGPACPLSSQLPEPSHGTVDND